MGKFHTKADTAPFTKPTNVAPEFCLPCGTKDCATC